MTFPLQLVQTPLDRALVTLKQLVVLFLPTLFTQQTHGPLLWGGTHVDERPPCLQGQNVGRPKGPCPFGYLVFISPLLPSGNNLPFIGVPNLVPSPKKQTQLAPLNLRSIRRNTLKWKRELVGKFVYLPPTKRIPVLLDKDTLLANIQHLNRVTLPSRHPLYDLKKFPKNRPHPFAYTHRTVIPTSHRPTPPLPIRLNTYRPLQRLRNTIGIGTVTHRHSEPSTTDSQPMAPYRAATTLYYKRTATNCPSTQKRRLTLSKRKTFTAESINASSHSTATPATNTIVTFTYIVVTCAYSYERPGTVISTRARAGGGQNTDT